jgi:hypothetical protein
MAPTANLSYLPVAIDWLAAAQGKPKGILDVPAAPAAIDWFAAALSGTDWFATNNATARIDLPAEPAASAAIDWLAASQGKPKGNKTKKNRKIDCTCRNCLSNLPHLPQLTDSQPHKASRKATKTNKTKNRKIDCTYRTCLPHLLQLTDSQPHKASRKATKNHKIDCTCRNCLSNLPQLTDSQPHKASRKATKNHNIDCTCRNCLSNLPQLTDSQPHKASRKATKKTQHWLHLPQLPAKPAAIDWLAAAQGKPKDNKNKQTKPKNRKIDCTYRICRNCLPKLPHLPQLTDPLPHKANHHKIDCTCRTCRNCLPNPLHLPYTAAYLYWHEEFRNMILKHCCNCFIFPRQKYRTDRDEFTAQ